MKTYSLRVIAVAVLIVCTRVAAQIAADPNAPGNQRPTVLQSANGVPQVNIQTPSAAGVSRNVFRQFDVDNRGAILNNSRGKTQTQLGGMVAGNPWLATGTARVILSEVNSVNPSLLNGYVEVAGKRAEVIIANPAGIQVNGGGFINASGVTLTTGTPVMDGGNLESFRVQRGQITVGGNGLDTGDANYTRILARAVQVNSGVWAKDLTLIAGTNEIAALASGVAAQINPIAGEGSAPGYMLDVAALGGMYAGKIYLVGTEAGVGVNNRGTIASQTGAWVLRADGWLVNTGRIQSAGDITIGVSGPVTNSGADAVSPSSNPSAGYLVETDPRFTNSRQWLSSDYMLGFINIGSSIPHKRLGDGFYEQKLIRDQVKKLTVSTTGSSSTPHLQPQDR